MESSPQLNPEPPKKPAKDNHLAQAWTVLLLAAIFGTALAAVQVNLSGVIAANKLNETLARVPELIWGPAAAPEASQDPSVDITPGTLAVERGGKKTFYRLYRVVRDEQPAGWVVKAQGQGYADKIELLLGLDPAASAITGLFVLEQKETPGLGNKITFPAWRNQFNGKPTDTPLVVVKGTDTTPQGIDAITGATISSRSVTDIVNRTTADVKGRLTPAAIQFSERPL